MRLLSYLPFHVDVVARPDHWGILGVNMTLLGENETGEVRVGFAPRHGVVPAINSCISTGDIYSLDYLN